MLNSILAAADPIRNVLCSHIAIAFALILTPAACQILARLGMSLNQLRLFLRSREEERILCPFRLELY
jgi:hypothetical protein